MFVISDDVFREDDHRDHGDSGEDIADKNLAAVIMPVAERGRKPIKTGRDKGDSGEISHFVPEVSIRFVSHQAFHSKAAHPEKSGDGHQEIGSVGFGLRVAEKNEKAERNVEHAGGDI